MRGARCDRGPGHRAARQQLALSSSRGAEARDGAWAARGAAFASRRIDDDNCAEPDVEGGGGQWGLWRSLSLGIGLVNKCSAVDADAEAFECQRICKSVGVPANLRQSCYWDVRAARALAVPNWAEELQEGDECPADIPLLDHLAI